MRILSLLVIALALLLAWSPGEAQRRGSSGDPVVDVLRRPPATGILVIDVDHDSPAWHGNIARGDIVTSYNEHPITTVEQLETALWDARLREKVPAVVWRDGQAFGTEVATGSLGIDGRAVQEGRGADPFRSPSRFEPEYGIFAEPQETWREFFLGHIKAGFSYEQRRNEEERLHMEVLRRARALRLEEDLKVTGTFRFGPLLEVETLRVERGGSLLAEGRREGEEWVATHRANEIRFEAPEAMLPNIAIAEVIRTMPQRRGACVHFTLLEETEMRLSRGWEIYCSGESTISLPNRGTIRVWRYDQSRYGELEYTYWVNSDREMVRAHYGGPSDQLVPREQALKGLPDGIRPPG